MNLLEDNDISTEVESEEAIPSSNTDDNKSKKIILSNYLYINEENIIQARINIINKYLLMMKNEALFDGFNNMNCLYKLFLEK